RGPPSRPAPDPAARAPVMQASTRGGGGTVAGAHPDPGPGGDGPTAARGRGQRGGDRYAHHSSPATAAPSGRVRGRQASAPADVAVPVGAPPPVAEIGAEPGPPADAGGLVALRRERLTMGYRRATRPAVDSRVLTGPRGELWALDGPLGCGKTTTLKVINRLVEPTSGAVWLDGVDVRSLPVHELRRGIG